MKAEIQVKYKGKYDVIVVGSGPAGMAAAISAGRNGAKPLLMESLGRVGGSIEAKKNFSIYTTVKDKLGLPCAIDSYDVYQKRNDTYLREKILRYANWFAGSDKYKDVQEYYEL